MKQIGLYIKIGKDLHKKYKRFCKQNGLVMAKRIEGLLEMDIEKRLIKLPEVKL